MRKYEEEHYKYENIKEKIYPWVKSELTDSQALNGKRISEKDTPVVSFMEDLSVIFVIKREKMYLKSSRIICCLRIAISRNSITLPARI
ncbi:MAG: hypothetical protein ACLR71_22670 [[Clostridium] scindens]